MRKIPILCLGFLATFNALVHSAAAAATNSPITIQIDAAADRHAISPLIYGVAFASSNDLKALNLPLNRSGGNSTTRYNWQTNASNHANDWYFESLSESGSGPGASVDGFISDSKNGGAQAMITVPIIGWVAKLGPNSQRLSSYSIAKYGAQTDSDWQWFADAGNGVRSSDGQEITTNDPTDANLSVTTNFQSGWVQHLTNRWGTASSNGVRYYIMDNEWSIWHSTHRDVHPVGATMDEVLEKFCDYATLVKGMDTNALVLGPEEWGWSGYLYSGYDQQYGSQHNWSSFPDRAAHGNQDYMPWLLNQIHQRSTASGKRFTNGTFWRESASDEGPSLRSRAIAQATAVSTVSQGRQTSMWGMRRRLATCSTAWCVGPSSPRPIESWVKTKMLRSRMIAAMRRALRE